jgi:hypothetical protein
MRYERKYLFKRIDLKLLLSDLLNICDGINEYIVSSIYFDNIHETSYTQKIDGNMDKIKIRARYYNQNFNRVNLEAKIKRSDKSYKLKTKLNKKELDLLMSSNTIDLSSRKEGDDIGKIYYYLKYYGMQKKTCVLYSRIEMSLKSATKTRLTIDKDVYSSIPIGKQNYELNRLPALNRDLCILEIKSANNSVDSYMKFLLEKYSMKKEAISKYSLSVQAQKTFMGENCGFI